MDSLEVRIAFGFLGLHVVGALVVYQLGRIAAALEKLAERGVADAEGEG